MTTLWKKIKNVFRPQKNHKNNKNHKNEKNNQEDEITTISLENDHIIDKIVDRYLQNEYINIPLIPFLFEKYFYKMMLNIVFNILHKTIKNQDTIIYGHKLSFHMTMSDVEKSLSWKFDPKSFKEKNIAYFENMVDNFVKSNQIHIPFFPEDIEKRMYMNILLLLFGILDDTIRHTRIKILGHEIVLDFQKNNEIKSHDILNNESQNELEIQKIKKVYQQRKPIIDDIVKKLMTHHNKFIIPDFIEHRLYHMALTIFFYFMSQITNDFEIMFLHHHIKLHLQPI